MKSFAQKTAVITGAASGIGRALALELAREGCQLALADINEEGLQETRRLIDKPALKVSVRRLDVADRVAVHEFAANTLRDHGEVDIVINNAGVAVTAEIAELSYEDFEWIMDINFWGMVYGTKAFLPHLRQRPEAWLANISSIFGIIALPTQAAYHASKFAIRGFTESLRQEMADTPLHVSCVHPGGVKTPIVRNMRFVGTVSDRAETIDRFDQLARTTPEKAAKIIIRGMKKGKKRILVGRDAWFLDRVQRWFPVAYEKHVSRMLNP